MFTHVTHTGRCRNATVDDRYEIDAKVVLCANNTGDGKLLQRSYSAAHDDDTNGCDSCFVDVF